MNFYITISNGLLKDGHRKRMGSAVWEFMWMLDKITRVDEDGTGWVLGGKAIKLKTISDDLGTHPNTVSENIIKLEKEGYIEKRIAPHGIELKVKRAKKRFGENTEPGSVKTLNHPSRGSVKTLNQVPEKTEPRPEKTEPYIRCKTVTVDNTVRQKNITTTAPNEKISFDADAGKFVNLGDRVEYWKKQFPAIDVRQEIQKAETWVRANPKNRKSNWERFLVNWLIREQDRAGPKRQVNKHAGIDQWMEEKERELEAGHAGD
jgi:hypothetical protein